MDKVLTPGRRVVVKPTSDMATFLWGAQGHIVPSPSPQVMRDRCLMMFDAPVTHPYGGALGAIWVDESMVDLITEGMMR